MDPLAHYALELTQPIAVAINLSGLRGRAQNKGIVDNRYECRPGKYYRRSVWHLYCSRDIAELLLDELAECLHKTDDRVFRQSIALTISAISVELDHTGIPKDVLIQSPRSGR